MPSRANCAASTDIHSPYRKRHFDERFVCPSLPVGGHPAHACGYRKDGASALLLMLRTQNLSQNPLPRSKRWMHP